MKKFIVALTLLGSVFSFAEAESWSCEAYCGYHSQPICNDATLDYSEDFLELVLRGSCLALVDTQGIWLSSQGSSAWGAWRGLRSQCSSVYNEYVLYKSSRYTPFADLSNSCGRE